jgi:hypothetical protein
MASGGAVTGALRLTTSEGRFTAARTAAPNVSATTTITRILLSFSPVSADHFSVVIGRTAENSIVESR